MNDPRRPQRFGPPLSGYGPTGPQVPPIRRPPTRLTPTSRRMHPRTAVTFPRRGLQEGPRQGLPSGPQAPTRPVRPNSCRSTGNTTSPRADFPRRADSPATARAENAALVVVRRRLSRAARRRVGHRTGYRQRLGQKANRDRAVTPMPGPSPTRPTTTTPTPPSPSAAPAPTTTTGTPSETVAGAMQTVVYDVTGEGRAISITYMDSGNVIQTEFNVALPWRKEVSLSKSSLHPASVTIVNIGHNVTCSVTVAGVQVRQRTGAGLTICDAPS